MLLFGQVVIQQTVMFYLHKKRRKRTKLQVKRLTRLKLRLISLTVEIKECKLSQEEIEVAR